MIYIYKIGEINYGQNFRRYQGILHFVWCENDIVIMYEDVCSFQRCVVEQVLK